jgi:hypothetical protein
VLAEYVVRGCVSTSPEKKLCTYVKTYILLLKFLNVAVIQRPRGEFRRRKEGRVRR